MEIFLLDEMDFSLDVLNATFFIELVRLIEWKTLKVFLDSTDEEATSGGDLSNIKRNVGVRKNNLRLTRFVARIATPFRNLP